MEHLKLPTNEILEKAKEIGFELAGFVSLSHWEKKGKIPWMNYWKEWLQKDFHGNMKYMENPKRKNPKEIYPWIKSVLCLGLVYATTPPPETKMTDRGRVSCYAYGQVDYHSFLKEKMEILAKWIYEQFGAKYALATDSFPLLEKPLAYLAGLGWIGKNTCLIHSKVGSFFFLGEILLDKDWTITPAIPHPNRCGTCTACIEACPTGALAAPYQLDSRKCISYLTIEYKGIIPHEISRKMGNWVFGCDICQEVCPWNRKKKETSFSVFEAHPRWQKPLPQLARSFFHGGFQKTFQNTPILRARRGGFLRNLLIAMENGKILDKELFQWAIEDSHPVVSFHGRRALENTQ